MSEFKDGPDLPGNLENEVFQIPAMQSTIHHIDKAGIC